MLYKNNEIIKRRNFCIDYKKVGKGIYVLVLFVKNQFTNRRIRLSHKKLLSIFIEQIF